MLSAVLGRGATTSWIKYGQKPFTQQRRFSGIAEFAGDIQTAMQFKLQALCTQEKLKEAVDQLYSTDPQHIYANVDTYNCLIECCKRARSLKEAERIHSHIRKSGQVIELSHRIMAMYTKCRSLKDAVFVFEEQGNREVVAWNALLSAHAELGKLEDARRVFNIIPKRNAVSWNAMIAAYAKHGRSEQAYDLFEHMMLKEQQTPTKHTFGSILRAFDKPEALEEGKLVHNHIVNFKMESDPDIGGPLILMYGKCGYVDDAIKVFRSIPSKNEFCWSSLIVSFVENARFEEVLRLFGEMCTERLEPNSPIFAKALDAIANLAFLAGGKVVHSFIVETRLEANSNVCNALILMYTRCACIDEALAVFDRMSSRDVVSWSMAIKAHLLNDNADKAIDMFKRMQAEGVALNEYIFSMILSTIEIFSEASAGKLIHSQVVEHKMDSNVVVNTALIDMYAKCGCLYEARWVFEKFKKKDKVLWTKMITLYTRRGSCEEALDLLESMVHEGVKPDVVTYVSALSACTTPATLAKGELIYAHLKDGGFESDIVVRTAVMTMYTRCGCLDLARKIFDELPQKDVIPWTAIIAAYIKHDNLEEAFQLFKQMYAEGVQPNQATFITIIDVCSNEGAWDSGKMIHKQIINEGCESDASVEIALMNMYAQCGCLEDMLATFSKTPTLSVQAWNTVIGAHTEHGKSKEALQLFQKMCQGDVSFVNPDRTTFVHVLRACNCASLVEEGREFFDCMKSKFRITPMAEHCNHMVDLLGRAGRLEEAEHYISEMQSQPGAFIWMTLLSACKLYSDVERGERAARHIFDVEPHNLEAYTLLASIYSMAGRSEDAASIKEEMEAKQSLV